MRKSIEISKELRAKFDAFQAASADDQPALRSELDALSDELDAANSAEKAARALADTTVLSEQDKKDIQRYSIAKAMRTVLAGKELDGIEAEMNDEAKREMKNATSRDLRGFGIPSVALQNARYDFNNSATATEGQEFKTTQYASYVEALRARLVMQKLGATYINGLVGTLSMPVGSNAAASWLAEEAQASVTKQTFGQKTMTPHGLQILCGYTRDLLAQSSYAVDQIILNEMIRAHANAVDKAAIQGNGQSGAPTGILSASNVNAVALGTNGAAPTFAKLVEMETAVLDHDAMGDGLSYLFNPKVNGFLKSTPKIEGYPAYMVEDGRVNGYGFEMTTNVPSNLTKGEGSNLSAIIFGDFRECWIGQWGGLDILLDPFTSEDKRVIKVSAVAYHDILVRRPEVFAKIVDAKLS